MHMCDLRIQSTSGYKNSMECLQYVHIMVTKCLCICLLTLYTDLHVRVKVYFGLKGSCTSSEEFFATLRILRKLRSHMCIEFILY